MAAAEGGRHDDPVADLEVLHFLADFLDDADALVAEDGSGLHAGQGAANHVQVGAANGAGGEADDGVGGFLNAGLRDVFQADVADLVEHDGFHGGFSLGTRTSQAAYARGKARLHIHCT